MTVSPASLVALPDDGPLTAKALARTYETPSYADPYEAIEDYVRVRKAAAGRDVGSQALATELELPRSRIRPWLQGSAPDPARAVAIGTTNRWFGSDDSIVRAWAILVAGIYAGGGIESVGYTPTWTVQPVQASDRICDALATLGVGATRIERDDHADEYRPAEHASVLGRALVALGAPAGDKSASSVDELPEWLRSAGIGTRLAAVEVIVLYRGAGHQTKDTITLTESDRSPAYRRSLADLIGSVVQGPVTAGEHAVYISAEAARELGMGRSGALRGAIERA